MISSFTHHGRIPIADLSTEDALRRWPRLIAHLIAESLGYFTPEGAANALLLFKRGQENWCEWFMHMAALDVSRCGKSRRRQSGAPSTSVGITAAT